MRPPDGFCHAPLMYSWRHVRFQTGRASVCALRHGDRAAARGHDTSGLVDCVLQRIAGLDEQGGQAFAVLVDFTLVVVSVLLD